MKPDPRHLPKSAALGVIEGDVLNTERLVATGNLGQFEGHTLHGQNGHGTSRRRGVVGHQADVRQHQGARVLVVDLAEGQLRVEVFVRHRQQFMPQPLLHGGTARPRRRELEGARRGAAWGPARGRGVDGGQDARDIGRESRLEASPWPQGAVVVACGGESTVTLGADAASRFGQGGPNQEAAIGAALALSGVEGVVVVFIDTDGSDGGTEVAGGLVDWSTHLRATKLGIDLRRALVAHETRQPWQQSVMPL